MPSRVFDSIDAIVAVLQGAGLTVRDGPAVVGDFDNAVYIGYDADPDSDWKAADIDQEWVGLGAKKRDETFSITCAAVALFDETPKSGRDKVKAIFATIENTLRSDPSLGFSPPYVAAVHPINLFYDEDNARLVFNITVNTRV